jgi:hypothetical protein
MEQLAVADWIVPSLAQVKIEVLAGDRGLELEFTPLPRPSSPS